MKSSWQGYCGSSRAGGDSLRYDAKWPGQRNGVWNLRSTTLFGSLRLCSSVAENQQRLPLEGQPCIDLQVAAHKRTRLPLPESRHAPAICGATILLETLQCERPRADVKSAPASNAGARQKGIQPQCKYRTMSESQCYRK